MEVMEDGNLMDKVLILIQRDMEYYKSHQAILQEVICAGIVGGRLDFPRSASFASMKLVLWWEEEYVAAYRKNSGFLHKSGTCDKLVETPGGCGGIVKASDPAKFVGLINKSSEQLLEHLHVLTQEALDHADLTVLTGTIGAAALIKNCLWFYLQAINDVKGTQLDLLHESLKRYQEMCEALAERLLDLHCRLLSLYILQEADSLDWENHKAFCESERGSFVIQMWWLYMQGTKEDLWSTVPPKMAQRVFSGMLNESLTILTVRYMRARPSEARSKLLTVDISNLLLCVAQLLPSICDRAEELTGVNLPHQSKILRDIHAKCQELLSCLLLRGAPLDVLYKIFHKGIESVDLFKSKTGGVAIWVVFALPHVFKSQQIMEISAEMEIALELTVLLAQPQPNWALLLKILTSKNCALLQWILEVGFANFGENVQQPAGKTEPCGVFLCPGDGSCKDIDSSHSILTQNHYYDLIASATKLLLSVENNDILSGVLLNQVSKQSDWAKCLDRRHVWNQIRPPWYETVLSLVDPLIPTIRKAVINAIQTGASMYQAMLITLGCFSQLWDCVGTLLPRIANLIQDILPASVTPLNHSVLLQILIGALYSDLLHESELVNQKQVKFSPGAPKDADVALAIAEALCSIDEDDKHTDQIEEFLEEVKVSLDENPEEVGKERSDELLELLTSDILMSATGIKSLKILYAFLKNNSEWFMQKLGVSEEPEEVTPNKVIAAPTTLLHTMFHIGYRSFDQLLTGLWQPNWLVLLQTPMALTPDRVWNQLCSRWEFQEVNSAGLNLRSVQIVNSLTSLLKQG